MNFDYFMVLKCHCSSLNLGPTPFFLQHILPLIGCNSRDYEENWHVIHSTDIYLVIRVNRYVVVTRDTDGILSLLDFTWMNCEDWYFISSC